MFEGFYKSPLNVNGGTVCFFVFEERKDGRMEMGRKIGRKNEGTWWGQWRRRGRREGWEGMNDE